MLPHRSSGSHPAQRWCSLEQRLVHLWLTMCMRGAQWAMQACRRRIAPSVQALREGVTERISDAGGRVDYVEVDALCLRSLHLCCCVKSSLALLPHALPGLMACMLPHSG